jgi:hypothetical protein
VGLHHDDGVARPKRKMLLNGRLRGIDSEGEALQHIEMTPLALGAMRPTADRSLDALVPSGNVARYPLL